MLPAYFTALGTASSAATIPITLAQTKKNGVSDDIASFCIPLCATIHIAGSMMKSPAAPSPYASSASCPTRCRSSCISSCS